MIIITGGSGFIGSALAKELNHRGFQDVVLVDQDLENSDKVKNIKNLKYTDYLDSSDFLLKLENDHFKSIDAIFHQGACSSTTEMDIAYLKENNTEYSKRLATWCMKNDVYFSYASSAATYGNGELGYSDDNALTPQLKPLNPYGDSKLHFDQWVIDHGHDKQIIGFKYFNVYGPNEYHKQEMRSMVHKGYGQILEQGKLRLFKSYKPEYSDGGQMRDFVYIKDVVKTILWFFENQEHKGIYNCGAGKAQSWNQLAESLFSAMNKPTNIEYIEMPDSIKDQYQYFTEADLTKLRRTGCPTQFQNLESGVADYVKNHLQKENPYL